MDNSKKIGLSEAKKLLLDILDARKNGSIETDQEMEDKIFMLLDDTNIRAALFNGDDPKSWYPPLSAWKKAKFDEAYRKWKAKK